MRLWKSIFNFYIQSSIHVALAICALTAITVLSYDLPWDFWRFVFIFSASITGYNFAKFAGKAGLYHRSLAWNLKEIQVFSFFCFLLLIFAAFKQSFLFLMINSVLALLTVFYSIPFFKKPHGLRQLSGLKIFIIAAVWSGATLWLPLANNKQLLSWDVLDRTLSYFVFVLALILPFEIRDLKYDNSNLGTFPQRFGIANTRVFGYLLLMIFVVLNYFLPSVNSHQFIISVVIALLTMVLIRFANTSNVNYYASFWVESVPIIWFALLWLT